VTPQNDYPDTPPSSLLDESREFRRVRFHVAPETL